MPKSSTPTHDQDLSSKDRGELFALTRALSITRLAYRTLRGRSRPSPHPALATPEIIAAVASPALTPWDMIDEHDTEGGVAFTFFQQRSEPHPAQSAA